MNRFVRLTGACAIVFAGSAAAAPEFNVDFEPAADGRTTMWLSYLADSNVTALDFAVDLDVEEPVYGDAKGCLSSLPKSHRGVCEFDGRTLKGVIYSPGNRPLLDTNLGSVVLDPESLLKADGANAKVGLGDVRVTTVTPQGITVAAEVRVSGQLAQSGK